VQGEVAGVDSVTLTTQQLPSHNHNVAVYSGNATLQSPIGNYLASASAAFGNVFEPPSLKVNQSGAPLQASGGGQPHENRQPFLALNYIIALEGIFPSRN
jgi:microcystin-dependent protein